MPEIYDMGRMMDQLLPQGDDTTWADALPDAYRVWCCSKSWMVGYSGVFMLVVSNLTYKARAFIFIP